MPKNKKSAQKETYNCIMCGSLSTDPKKMYVLEDRVNNKIYLRCEKCEKEGQDKIITIIKN